MGELDMTDKATADAIRLWCSKARMPFSWPTDACGYRQHMRFVLHRNNNWKGGGPEAFNAFALAYADSLDAPATPQSLTPSGQTDVGTGGTSGREGGRRG